MREQKYVITFTLTQHQVRMLRQSSLERVFNTAMSISDELDAPAKCEDGWINYEDMEEMKPLASQLWDAARAATYKQ